jgi:hypothetical protein
MVRTFHTCHAFDQGRLGGGLHIFWVRAAGTMFDPSENPPMPRPAHSVPVTWRHFPLMRPPLRPHPLAPDTSEIFPPSLLYLVIGSHFYGLAAVQRAGTDYESFRIWKEKYDPK